MNQIQQSLNKLNGELKDSKAELVAVSKYHSVESLSEAYSYGQRKFGESHVQELCMKEEVLPKDIEWHFIGHLQTNKVKFIIPFVSLIHAVDTIKLLKEIDKQAAKCGRIVDCLLQVHIAQEETKYGFSPEELNAVISEGEWKSMKHIRITGLMCMATNTDNEEQIRAEFRSVKDLFDQIKVKFFPEERSFRHLSMGMSHDYHIAIEEGSTLIRVGSMIFGERNYETKYT